MLGPEILVRTLGKPAVTDAFGNKWQYHSRSDRHSKVACWCVLFDLLRRCRLLREHIAAGKVAFGVNHTMADFSTGRVKNLDLVICTPGLASAKGAQSFRARAATWELVLATTDVAELDKLPALLAAPVGAVHIALEAKACMTAHVKAIPRLHDELNSSHLAIHGSSDAAIAGGFLMLNLADSFVSPDRNKSPLTKTNRVVSKHHQPKDAERVIAKIKEIPRRANYKEVGFDALGIVVVSMKNDGSPVALVHDPPAPASSDIFQYGQMIRRLAHLYETRFAAV